MKKIVGVTFEKNGRMTYFIVNEKYEKQIKKGCNVLVKTDIGLQFGKIVTEIHNIDETKLNKELTEIVKLATKKDYLKHVENLKESKYALKKCNELIKKYKLDMKLIDAFYTFNREQLIFRFYAEKRVDF